MNQTKKESLPKGIEWSFEVMGVMYVATAFLFLVNPDWLILTANRAFSDFGWPVVHFPTERFWLSLAITVPGTRAFLVFVASRRPAEARLCVKVLQVTLLIPAATFAWQFLFHKHAAIFALGFFTELLQVSFYSFLHRKLPA